jgi:sugar phosphate isomerase/epimerase
MKLGILTVGLSPMSINEIIAWAADTGFETIEVACWPEDNSRPFKGTQLDVTKITEEQSSEILLDCQKYNIDISCLTYCGNNLAHDEAERATTIEHLLKVIDAAAMLQVDTVCTFIGRDETLPIAANIELAGDVFKSILEYAADRNIRICVENCPMPGWQYEGLVGNVAHTPNIWDQLFEVLPQENFGLNFDPSHLQWLGIDPVRAAKEYANKAFYAHAKDTYVSKEQLYRRGIMDLTNGGWRHGKIPGNGEIDFRAVITALHEGGYDGPLSIELEERGWIETCEKVQEGFILSQSYLKPLLDKLC